jgi:hypothetical protein
MNSKNLWISVLSGAVLTTLVSNLPYIGFVNFLCFIGFWGSAIFAIWLYRRLNGTLTLADGLRIGALTGLCAGIMGFALSFLGVAGLQGIMNDVEGIIPADASGGNTDIPLLGAVAFNIFGVILNVLFGTIGGWIGGAIFRTDRVTKTAGGSHE